MVKNLWDDEKFMWIAFVLFTISMIALGIVNYALTH